MDSFNDKSKVSKTLNRLDFKPKKSRGQNFLLDEGISREIVAQAKITELDAVVEIGPGLGAITKYILDRSENVLAIEIDPKLALEVETRYPKLKGKILCRDIRDISGKELSELLGVKKFIFISNVPYSISTEVVLWCIENRDYISKAVLLLQKEFAERIAASPGVREGGSLTVLRAVHADASLGLTVSGDSFLPKANVESQLLSLFFYSQTKVEIENLAIFEKVVRAGFSKRRKTLYNSFLSSNLFSGKDEILEVISASGLDFKIRAEALKFQDWVKLLNNILQKTNVA
jgi:16S rRNA (adenine1518-N6/adenine1519-N6)-dimethyltransferase